MKIMMIHSYLQLKKYDGLRLIACKVKLYNTDILRGAQTLNVEKLNVELLIGVSLRII